MRKLERRAFICLMLAAVLFIGVSVFVFRFVRDGGRWATFYGNIGLYSGETLNSGNIYDRNDIPLMMTNEGLVIYNDNYNVRMGTIHAVGDMRGNVSTAALSVYRDRLIGYNLLTGTYSTKDKGEDLKLTIDAEACATAYAWLSAYDAGCVGVYNYKTGEILCAVSTPGFDPNNPPELAEGDDSGIYINRLFSATWVPGSIFKTVTAAAAIENIDWKNFHYTCTGEMGEGDNKVTCMEVHGEQDFNAALANSCNCAYAIMTKEIGAKKMEQYVKDFGLTTVYDMDGIKNAAGSFSFPTNSDIDLGWAGVGQWEDQVNPCSMMMYMGAIANGGKTAVPRMTVKSSLLDKVRKDQSASASDVELIKLTTASKLKEMMKYNVESVYGQWDFPGLSIGAKTGTGEVEDKLPNSTFAGFLDDPLHPYAFIVCVSNAGTGRQIAAPIANAVLQVLVN